MMADRQDYPPIALGRLDDRSGWRWLDESDGALDWTLTACVVVLAVPVMLVFGPIVLALRMMLKVGAKC